MIRAGAFGPYGRPVPITTHATQAPAATQPHDGSRERDRSIDLLRAACTVLVVLLHAMMVGVTIEQGAPVFTNALETPWFPPVSWFVQMMPLFFLAGGATAVGAWRRARARGVTAGGFVARRIRRLLAPALVTMAVVAAGLCALGVAGVPAHIVETAGFRISQPLWFLGVYVLVQALVPAMVRLHERGAALGVGIPLAAVLTIDAVRIGTGAEAVGFLGLAAVWLLVQQLGFLLGEGRIGSLAPTARIAIGGAALALLGGLTGSGLYSPDMYVNLNPPTLAIVLLGVAQLMAFSLLQPALRRLAENRVVAGLTDAIGDRAMTVYLWHMPVLIGLAGVGAALGLAGVVALPALGSGAWWASRPLWLLVASGAVAASVAAAGRFERVPGGAAVASGARSGVAAVLGVAAVAVVFVLGLDVPVAAASALLMAVALRLTARPGENPRSSRALTASRTAARGERLRASQPASANTAAAGVAATA